MKKAKLAIVLSGSIAGFAIATLVLGFYFWENGHRQYISRQLSDKLTNDSLIVCPPCFGVMALDSAGVTGWAFGLLEIVIMNAALYGLVGFIIYKIMEFTRANRR